MDKIYKTKKDHWIHLRIEKKYKDYIYNKGGCKYLRSLILKDINNKAI